MKTLFTPKLFIVFTFCLTCVLSSANAQFGVKLNYLQANAEQWVITGPGSTTEAPGQGWSAGVDYWFRLPTARIEFTPELNYAVQKIQVVDGPELKTEWYSFFFNTNIYLLDLLNDCDCPTFSKQNDFFAKGFFIQVSPGLSMPSFKNALSSGSSDRQNGDLHFSLGGGLGFDFGVSDFLTFSPIVQLRYFPEVNWQNSFPDEGLDSSYSIQDPKSSLLQWTAGLRIGIRLDSF